MNSIENRLNSIATEAAEAVAEARVATRSPALQVTEEVINVLLGEAAVFRRSYLGGDGKPIDDDDDAQRMYRTADLFDDLAEQLAPLCVPPLAEFEQACADCDDGTVYGRPCSSCRGTGLWPPTRDGVRFRLLPREVPS